MNNSKYITIGISFYNDEKYLSLAIQSIIMQSFEHWELILVDDGSTDSSLRIARYFEGVDDRIRVISDGENRKLPVRLNQIIKEANNNYIARMDADDIIHPDRLKIQMDFLEANPHFDLVSTGVVSIDNNNNVYGYRNVSEIISNFEKVEKSYPIVHASILARKSWYTRNLYDENRPRSQDYELWCRAVSNQDLKIAILPDLLYYYREEGNLSLHKIVKSYNDSYKTYCKYSGSSEVTELLKVKLKVFAVKLLNKTGLLQSIASKRNKNKMSENLKYYHQTIIDKLTTKPVIKKQ